MTGSIMINRDVADYDSSVMTLCLEVYELPTGGYLQVSVLSPGQGDVLGGVELDLQ